MNGVQFIKTNLKAGQRVIVTIPCTRIRFEGPELVLGGIPGLAPWNWHVAFCDTGGTWCIAEEWRHKFRLTDAKNRELGFIADQFQIIKVF